MSSLHRLGGRNGTNLRGHHSLTYQREIREVQVPVAIPGFRPESLVVVTSLQDSEEVPLEELAELYRQDWPVELLTPLQSIRQLDVLRRKTQERVRQEL